MRVTNSTKEYISKAIWEKADKKYSALNEKLETERKALKELGKKFMSEQEAILEKAKADVMKLVKKYGLTFRHDEEGRCILFDEGSFKELCSYDRHSKEYDKADAAVDHFKSEVKHKISEIIFHLECGGNAADILRLIEEVKF